MKHVVASSIAALLVACGGSQPAPDAPPPAGSPAEAPMPADFHDMNRDQRIVGMLVIRRKTVGVFPPAVVELLQTFASQSVVAIEKLALFRSE